MGDKNLAEVTSRRQRSRVWPSVGIYVGVGGRGDKGDMCRTCYLEMLT